VPFLHVTTRIDGRKDEDLLFDVGGSEFPTIVFLDADGEVIGRHDMGDNSVPALERTAAKVERCLELAKRLKSDARVRADLEIARCELGLIEYFDLESELEGLTLTPDQQKAVATLGADNSVWEMTQVLRRVRDEAAREQAVEEFLALYRAGHHPARASNRAVYWDLLADHAVAAKDAALLGDALAALKELHGPTPSRRAKTRLAQLEAKLGELADGK